MCPTRLGVGVSTKTLDSRSPRLAGRTLTTRVNLPSMGKTRNGTEPSG